MESEAPAPKGDTAPATEPANATADQSSPEQTSAIGLQAEAAIAKLDANNDGVVSQEELAAGLAAGVMSKGDSFGHVVPEVDPNAELLNTTWDLCIVLPEDVVDDKEKSAKLQTLLQSLRDSGLFTSPVMASKTQGSKYFLVGASVQLLVQAADELNITVEVNEDPYITRPANYMDRRYEAFSAAGFDQGRYEAHGGADGTRFFQSGQRQALVRHIMRHATFTSIDDKGVKQQKQLNFNGGEVAGVVTEFFPMHEGSALKEVQSAWADQWGFYSDDTLEQCEAYFGAYFTVSVPHPCSMLTCLSHYPALWLSCTLPSWTTSPTHSCGRRPLALRAS